MSDGISVISEGEGHHTSPGQESDSPTVTPDASKEKKHFSFDAIRMTSAAKRSGYRPMTPPQTPPTEEEEAEGDDEHEASEDKKNRLATVQTNVMQPKKPKQKLDLESFAQDGEARRFIGIYPRHVVFLMVVCGIIGGMIGHLWNLNYGCNCDAKNEELVDMYNRVVAEKWTLQEMLNKYEGQGSEGAAAEPEERRPKLQPKQPPTKWTGHEDNDEFVTVEDEPETTTPAHKPIPTDQFEALIWDHLREPQKHEKHEKSADEMLAELRTRQSTEEAYARALLEKRQRETGKSHGGGHSKNKRSAEDTRRDSDEGKIHERKAKEVWTKKEQDSSGEKYKYTKSASSREAKYQGEGKYETRGGSGSGSSGRAGKFRGRGDSDEDMSSESDKKSRNYDKKYQQKRSSGEWSDKRNRGRDEQRQQQRAGEKNWYLERGREREIDRIETMAA